jgi:hypothetical protein
LTNNAGAILQTGTTPTFNVTTIGTYEIHTVVVNPTTITLANYNNISTLNAVLIQGGGVICGVVELTGAVFVVKDCTIIDPNCTKPEVTSVTAINSNCGQESFTHGHQTKASQEQRPTAAFLCQQVVTS